MTGGKAQAVDLAEHRTTGALEDKLISRARRHRDRIGAIAVGDGTADHGAELIVKFDDITSARRRFARIEPAVAIQILEHAADDSGEQWVDGEWHHRIDSAGTQLVGADGGGVVDVGIASAAGGDVIRGQHIGAAVEPRLARIEDAGVRRIAACISKLDHRVGDGDAGQRQGAAIGDRHRVRNCIAGGSSGHSVAVVIGAALRRRHQVDAGRHTDRYRRHGGNDGSALVAAGRHGIVDDRREGGLQLRQHEYSRGKAARNLAVSARLVALILMLAQLRHCFISNGKPCPTAHRTRLA